MIPWLNKDAKQKRKTIEHAHFQVKYARRMNEDRLLEENLSSLRQYQTELKECLKTKSYDQGVKLAEKADALAKKLHPAPDNKYGLRENVEVFVVVMAVALGFRTYFFQPYQIPTGSMQPTLYGITSVADYEPDWTDKPPFRWGKFLLTGSRYREIKAKTTGRWDGSGSQLDTFVVIPIEGKSHKFHGGMPLLIEKGQLVKKGQVIARGLQKQGDNIIVNRLITNFRKPRRGDITVFSTKGLPLRRENSAYIKRLVGMPGETLSICNGKLFADGDVVEDPDVFLRQYENPHYPGYRHIDFSASYFSEFPQVEPKFYNCEYKLTLGEDEYLMMGDNTTSSLDGRYFGAVPGENIIGIGFFVPWPFFNRGIHNDNAGLVR